MCCQTRSKSEINISYNWNEFTVSVNLNTCLVKLYISRTTESAVHVRGEKGCVPEMYQQREKPAPLI